MKKYQKACLLAIFTAISWGTCNEAWSAGTSNKTELSHLTSSPSEPAKEDEKPLTLPPNTVAIIPLIIKFDFGY